MVDGDLEQVSLVSRLVFGVGIPAVIIGGIELGEWIAARRQLTKREAASVSPTAQQFSATAASKRRAVASETQPAP